MQNLNSLFQNLIYFWSPWKQIAINILINLYIYFNPFMDHPLFNSFGFIETVKYLMPSTKLL